MITPETTPQDVVADLDRVTRKVCASQTRNALALAAADMTRELESHGVSFEGDVLPISLTPTLVPVAEAERVADAGKRIRAVLNRAIALFIDEHNDRRLDAPMHRFFAPYYRWWDAIAAEHRRHEPIQLMRLDAVRSHDGRWSFMETNTACPGGTIHCSRIRTAWRSTSLGQQACIDECIDEHPIDDATGFVRFMAERAREISSTEPNIAILTYRGNYTNELESLRRCHSALRATGELTGNLLLGDIRDVQCVDGRAMLHGQPIALIYNKFDPLQFDPRDGAVRGWADAAIGPDTVFLNSLGSMYLTEAKRSLALLSDPSWNRFLGLSAEEACAIQDYVPYTRLVEDLASYGAVHTSLPARARRSFVLKADCLTRGSGVFIGDQVTEAAWMEALAATRLHHGVAQCKCDLPSRVSTQVGPTGELVELTEFFGIDVFYFGDTFGGLVGRSHTSQVFNVGNGGRETPVLIIGASDG